MPHLIETYSMRCGVKIDTPFILEKFFPLGAEKYITIHPYSKYDSKCYDFMQDVVNDLLPILSNLGISIVQIGAQNEKQLKGCYSTVGQTNIGQCAYIISKSMLHLGADSFATHIASYYKKKIVALYSNNFAKIVRPYWGNEKDHILLEPDRKTQKPSFSEKENPKTINRIQPEKIVSAVCDLLGVDFTPKFKTVCIGQNYSNLVVETVPNQILDLNQFGLNSIVERMDFEFNENVLIEQLKISKCSIITDKPIKYDILSYFRKNIEDVIFKINSFGVSDFVKTLSSLNFNTFLVSDMKGDDVSRLKLEYLDYGNINISPDYNKERDDTKTQIKERPSFYKSSKITLSNGKIYPSKAAYLEDSPVGSVSYEPQPIIDNEEFWKEMDYFKILV